MRAVRARVLAGMASVLPSAKPPAAARECRPPSGGARARKAALPDRLLLLQLRPGDPPGPIARSFPSAADAGSLASVPAAAGDAVWSIQSRGLALQVSGARGIFAQAHLSWPSTLAASSRPAISAARLARARRCNTASHSGPGLKQAGFRLSVEAKSADLSAFRSESSALSPPGQNASCRLLRHSRPASGDPAIRRSDSSARPFRVFRVLIELSRNRSWSLRWRLVVGSWRWRGRGDVTCGVRIHRSRNFIQLLRNGRPVSSAPRLLPAAVPAHPAGRCDALRCAAASTESSCQRCQAPCCSGLTRSQLHSGLGGRCSCPPGTSSSSRCSPTFKNGGARASWLRPLANRSPLNPHRLAARYHLDRGHRSRAPDPGSCSACWPRGADDPTACASSPWSRASPSPATPRLRLKLLASPQDGWASCCRPARGGTIAARCCDPPTPEAPFAALHWPCRRLSSWRGQLTLLLNGSVAAV